MNQVSIFWKCFFVGNVRRKDICYNSTFQSYGLDMYFEIFGQHPIPIRKRLKKW